MIQPITTDEATRIAREWPARRQDIDYTLHTAECGEEWRDEKDAHNPCAWNGVIYALWLALCAVAILTIVVVSL
jgi:hypothetical protein